MYNWSWVKLGDICDVVRGGSPRPMGDPKYFNGDIPFIKISDITKDNSKYVVDSVTKVNKEGAKKSRYLPKGSLLLSNSGSVCIPKFLGVGACIHDGFVSFVNFRNQVDLNYLYNYFNYIRPFIIQEHKQGITQVNLNTKIVSEFDIPLPPLTEQHRIVEKVEELFSELDNGIENLKIAKEQIKTYRQAVLKSAFEGKLVQGKSKKRKDKSENGELPEGWEWVKLEYVLEDIRYGTSKKCYYKPEDIPVLRIPNVIDGSIDLRDLKYSKFSEKEIKDLSLHSGDILVIRSNGSLSIVGKSALVSKENEGLLYAGYLIRLRLNFSVINSSYLNYCFASQKLRSQIESKAKSTSGVNNVNSKELQDLDIPITDLKTQTQIVEEIEKRFSVADKMEAAIDESLKKAEALRQSILKQAFEGKLV